ncbi:hypothetical protein [Clostridium amazonitimonense]|uniref:hypothetical protein n=1 Tax=Clostridium amazonitimonense TaxID=1499689 RepID=UPI000509B66F|nr:hypothetical protein [Clostridium amazonitimonense]
MEKEILELLKQVNNKLDEHTMKLNEHTEILKALEHLAQVNRAEHDKMFNEIAHIKGETESIRKDLAAVEIVTARNMENLAHLKLIK